MQTMIINAKTGHVIVRDFTPHELAQREADAADASERLAATNADKSQRLATIQAARDHAASLGFTDAMLAVMYPNLTP